MSESLQRDPNERDSLAGFSDFERLSLFEKQRSIFHACDVLFPADPQSVTFEETDYNNALNICTEVGVSGEEELVLHLNEQLELKLGDSWQKMALAWATLEQDPENLDRLERLKGLIYENLGVLTDLWRSVGVEGIQRLSREYNICHFGRYPLEVLEAQAIYNKDDPPEGKDRYVVVLYPQSDHNGVFYETTLTLDLLHDRLRSTHSMVVAEASHRYQLRRNMAHITKMYAQDDHLAELVIFGGHGSRTEPKLQLGNEGHVHSEDFEERESAAIDRMVSSRAKLIALSCHSGKEGGLAETVSELFNRAVDAPVVATNLAKIEVATDDSGEIIDAKAIFRKGETAEFTGRKE